MGFISCVAKIIIIVAHLCVLLLAANQHKKVWKCDINFWYVLAAVVVSMAVLSASGFFGFISIAM